MRISYTPQQEELRRELRSYFAGLMTPERREALMSTTGEYGSGDVYRDTVAQMGRDGWLAALRGLHGVRKCLRGRWGLRSRGG